MPIIIMIISNNSSITINRYLRLLVSIFIDCLMSDNSFHHIMDTPQIQKFLYYFLMNFLVPLLPFDSCRVMKYIPDFSSEVLI